MQGREQGVAILSEGLAEKLDFAALGSVERDAYGNVRSLTELELGRVLKERVGASLRGAQDRGHYRGQGPGYELRCAPPGAHTGRTRVRYVDVESEAYQTLAAYMIRLKPEDLEHRETVTALARAGI